MIGFEIWEMAIDNATLIKVIEACQSLHNDVAEGNR